MIFPERVLGRSSVKRIVLGFAIGPIVDADVVAQLLDQRRRSARYRPAGSRTPRSPGPRSRRSARRPRPRRPRGGRRGRARPLPSRCCGPTRASRRRRDRAARSSRRRRASRRRRRSTARRTRPSTSRGSGPDRPRCRGASTATAASARGSHRPGSPTLSPVSSTMSAPMPGSGNVADPGFSVVAPGSGLIMMAPVSVCHHVSTTGQRSPPMCFQYQTQASGLIGSPTVPRSRSDGEVAPLAGTRRPTS